MALIRFELTKLCQSLSKALPGVWSTTVARPIEMDAVRFLPRSCHGGIVQDSQELPGIERGAHIDLNPVTCALRRGIASGGMICLGG